MWEQQTARVEGRAGLFLLLPAPRATRRDFLKWPRRPALCPMRARSRRLQPGMPGSGRSTAAFVPSDLGGAEGGAACRCRHPTTQRPPLPLPPPAARRAGSAGPERLSRSPGPCSLVPSRRQLTAEGAALHRRSRCLPAAPGSRPTPQTAFSSGALWEPRWQERRKEQPRGLEAGKQTPLCDRCYERRYMWEHITGDTLLTLGVMAGFLEEADLT